MFVSIKECSKDRVPSFCPSLTLKETRAVLDRFPQLGCVKTWIWRRRNPYYAASGIVLASGGPVFIKRHSSSVRNAHALMQEHRFIAHLRAAQLPVCEVLVDASGAGATASCRARLYSARAAHANPRWPLWDFCQRRSARAAGRADPQLSLPGAPACAPALARRGTQALAALSRPPVSAAPDAGDALDA